MLVMVEALETAGLRLAPLVYSYEIWKLVLGCSCFDPFDQFFLGIKGTSESIHNDVNIQRSLLTSTFFKIYICCKLITRAASIMERNYNSNAT